MSEPSGRSSPLKTNQNFIGTFNKTELRRPLESRRDPGPTWRTILAAIPVYRRKRGKQRSDHGRGSRRGRREPRHKVHRLGRFRIEENSTAERRVEGRRREEARSTPPGVVQPGGRRRSALNHPCPFTGAACAASSSKQTKSRLPVESWTRCSSMHEVNDRGSAREKIEIPENRCEGCLPKTKRTKKKEEEGGREEEVGPSRDLIFIARRGSLAGWLAGWQPV